MKKTSHQRYQTSERVLNRITALQPSLKQNPRAADTTELAFLAEMFVCKETKLSCDEYSETIKARILATASPKNANSLERIQKGIEGRLEQIMRILKDFAVPDDKIENKIDQLKSILKEDIGKVLGTLDLMHINLDNITNPEKGESDSGKYSVYLYLFIQLRNIVEEAILKLETNLAQSKSMIDSNNLISLRKMAANTNWCLDAINTTNNQPAR